MKKLDCYHHTDEMGMLYSCDYTRVPNFYIPRYPDYPVILPITPMTAWVLLCHCYCMNILLHNYAFCINLQFLCILLLNLTRVVFDFLFDLFREPPLLESHQSIVEVFCCTANKIST